jgi:ribA/ribD-fused uncharacterized protein
MSTVAAAPQAIMQFTGRWDCLSNFYPSPLMVGDGITYPTAEHAFQAMKTPDRGIRATIAAYTLPGAAKQAGRKLNLRPDWERIKKQVMLRVVMAKFARNPELALRLCATGNALLVEGNTWHDNYWGDCHCGQRAACEMPGLNYLGQILMAARFVLREDQPSVTASERFQTVTEETP